MLAATPAAGARTYPPPPSFAQAYVAHLVAPAPVRSSPRAATTQRVLGTRAAWGGGPVGLLVLDSATDAHGAVWVKVRLPSRPNDASGWIPAGRAEIVPTPWRVVLDLSERRMVVYRAGEPMKVLRAVVGKPSTPTPTGLFAISERIRQEPGSILGPWALHLTAHSDVFENFGGGPGRVAIHGRAGSLLADPLGSAASHGCIRVDSRAVIWMARRLREGTPVLVQP